MLYPGRQPRQIAGQFPLIGRGNPAMRGYPRLNLNDPINQGLVGYWSMDYPTLKGTSLFDLSGKGNTGTLVASPPIAVGRIGQALSFNGSSQYVTVPNSASYKSASQAFSFWMYPTQLPSVGFDGIVSIWTSDSDAFEVFINNNSSNLVAGNYPFYMSYTLPAANRWYHVYVQTVSGAGTLYVNGLLVSSGPVSYGGASNTAPLTIGARATYFFPGLIDDVRVYNRTPFPTGIYQIYSNTTGQLGLIVPRRPIVGSSAPGVSAPASVMVWS